MSPSEARVAVAPNKFSKGYQAGQEDVPAAYEIVDLREAISRVYTSDAHLVAYVVEGIAPVDGVTRQQRINKPGLAAYGKRVVVEAFFCDVDNAGHGVWTDEAFEAARAQDVSLDVLRRAGVYYTRHGRRIVQPLAAPIAVEIVEPYLRRWLAELEAAGLAVDWACRDWTRHFRLPHVRRGGRHERSRCVDLERMAPIALEPIELVSAEEPASERTPTASPPARLPPIAWSADAPARWAHLVAPLADAVRRVSTEWHTLFLAIAGALLSRGVPEEHVPALCRAISIATGSDTRTEDRERGARSSVERRRARQRYAGCRALATAWPEVARAFDAALRPPSPPAPTRPSIDVTAQSLKDTIAHLPDGLTMIAAGCGVGKTRAAIAVAVERAQTPYASPDAAGRRAPPQSKTSIAVDKHLLAKQIDHDIAAHGVSVRRHFGPLSLRREDGAYECRYRDVAAPLVDGGQSMQWELCKGRGVRPCEHFETCRAKDGFEGPADARIAVGPHALVATLSEAAGATGLLVIDEPPSLVESISIGSTQLDLAREMRHAFDATYAAAMLPALDALRAWATRGELDELTTVEDAVRAFDAEIAPEVLAEARRWARVSGGAVDCARAALGDEDGPRAPPLRFEHVQIARSSQAHAKQLGAASGVFDMLYRALVSETPVAARVEARGRGRAIVVMRARDALSRALRRQGAVVVLDANADLHAPIFAKVVGYDRPVLRFDADDGAPIERTMIRLRSATRSAWQPHGKFVVASSLKTALTLAMRWAREDATARTLGVITTILARTAIEACLAPEDSSVDEQWAKLSQDPETLAEARAALGPIVRTWPGKMIFGHYGATRGLDAMADADALVTLGDPWINVGDAKAEAAFLGVEDWEARYEALCRAELEQAHGRLRTVHRTRAGRALHVGAIRPSGRGWEREDVRVVEAPRRIGRAVEAGQGAEVAAAIAQQGGVKALARLWGCAPKTVREYRDGVRAVTAEMTRRAATAP